MPLRCGVPHLVIISVEEVSLVLETKVACVLSDAILDLLGELDGIGGQGLEVGVHVIHG